MILGQLVPLPQAEGGSRGNLLSPQPMSSSAYNPGSTPSPLLATNAPRLAARQAEAIVQLTTTLVLPHFRDHYPTQAVEGFLPAYTQYPDGSLLAPPFLLEHRTANIRLIFTASLALLFLIHTWKAANFLRRARGKVRKNVLFYILFASQALGSIAFIPRLVAHINPNVHCTRILQISSPPVIISLGLMISGIWGVKAYRYLGNSLCVAFGVATLRVAIMVVAVLELIYMKGTRGLTGGCARRPRQILTSTFVVLQLLELGFICGCFIYTIVKSNLPAPRGRIPITLSLEVAGVCHKNDPEKSPKPFDFWDRITKHERPPPSADVPQSIANSVHEWMGPLRNKLRRSRRSTPESNTSSLGHMAQSTVVSTDTDVVNGQRFASFIKLDGKNNQTMLFLEVLREEIIYTAAPLIVGITVAILAVTGVLDGQRNLDYDGWISITWALMSILIMHSFSHALRRHEDEDFLQNYVVRSEQATAQAQRHKRWSRRALPARSLSPHGRRGDSLWSTLGPTDVKETPRASSQNQKHERPVSLASWDSRFIVQVGSSSERPRSPSDASSIGPVPELSPRASFLYLSSSTSTRRGPDSVGNSATQE